jgi:hypothetical protein
VGNSPFGLVGLTLWLKPENIGVCCGSLITGASMDIWRDASLSQNHALPPKWDSWDNETILGIAKSSSSSVSWNQSVWNTNACDNIEFRLGKHSLPVQGVSYDKGNVFMFGFWGAGGTGPLGTGGNVVGLGYQRLDFAFYILANDNVNPATPRLTYSEFGRTAGTLAGLPNDGVLDSYKSSTVFGISHDKTANTITYYKKDTLTSSPIVLRTYPGGVSAGEIFYADSAWVNPNSRCEIVKAQNNGVDLPISGWTGTSSMQFAQVKGLTIDKLRPTLVVNDRGYAGRTGIQFNGGVLYGPHTVWTQAGLCGGYVGVTLGSNPATPFVSGQKGESIQTGQHFRLTRGISLTKDMSVFIVFRAGTTASGYTASNFGLGLASSSKRLADFSPAVENPRTNLLSNTSDLSNTTNWPSLVSTGGVTPSRTYGVAAPDGTLTATRITFQITSLPSADEYSFIRQVIPNLIKNNPYGGFVWMRSSTGTATAYLRHVAASAYTVLNLTTTWQKFYIPETAYSSSNFLMGLRNTIGSITVDIWQPQLFSEWGLTPFTSETDHLLYHRSYSDIDADSTKQNSRYYFVNSGTNESFYPYESGLVGLRSNTGSTTASRIAFNPYRETTTGVSLENISLGEWRRNPDGRIQSFYNGEESTNYSVETARRIARPDSLGGSNPSNFAASEVSYNGATLDIGQFGAFCLPVLDAPYSDSTASANFVAAALGNTPYSFGGVIYEILVYDRVLDQNERLLVYAYLSRKYRLEASLGQFFEGAGFGCYPAAVAAGYPYWYIAKHPNAAGSRSVPRGTSMGNITIQALLSLYGLVYKSAGTRLANGTVLTKDTYDTLGE